MKLKLATIVNPHFSTGLNKVCVLPVPIKTAYALGKVCRQIEAELTEFNDAKIKCFRSHGAVENNGRLELSPEKSELVRKDMDELLSSEIELFLKEPVTLPDSCDSLTTFEVIALADLICLPVEVESEASVTVLP